MPANDRQVAGTHYRKTPGEQHWDRVHRLGLNYFQAMVTRYVERYHDKNGVEDLEKAAHFLQKLIELEKAKSLGSAKPLVPHGYAARDDVDLNSAVFDRIRERATTERELENDNT